MTIGLGLCAYCEHLTHEPALVDGGPSSTCAAFPDGIPLNVFAGRVDHRIPLGDEAVTFTARPDVDAETLDRVYALLKESPQ